MSHSKISGRRSVLAIVSLVAVVAAAIVVVGKMMPRAPATYGPDTIVLVNGDDISAAQFARVRADLLELSRQQLPPGAAPPDDAELDELAVQQLIDRQLMLQEARRRGMSVADDDVDVAISDLRQRFPDLDNLALWMRERGLTDLSLINTLREDILAGRLREALVADIEVSQAQVRDYYDAMNGEVPVGEEVRLGLITVDSQDMADEVLTALANGESFNSLGHRYATAPSGDTGWVDAATLPLPLQQAVAEIDEGEAAGPVRKDDDEFVVVALAGRRVVNATNIKQVYAELERRLLTGMRQAAVHQWLAEQRSKAEIEILMPPG